MSIVQSALKGGGSKEGCLALLIAARQEKGSQTIREADPGGNNVQGEADGHCAHARRREVQP